MANKKSRYQEILSGLKKENPDANYKELQKQASELAKKEKEDTDKEKVTDQDAVDEAQINEQNYGVNANRIKDIIEKSKARKERIGSNEGEFAKKKSIYDGINVNKGDLNSIKSALFTAGFAHNQYKFISCGSTSPYRTLIIDKVSGRTIDEFKFMTRFSE